MSAFSMPSLWPSRGDPRDDHDDKGSVTTESRGSHLQLQSSSKSAMKAEAVIK